MDLPTLVGFGCIAALLALAYLGPSRWQHALRRRHEPRRHGIHDVATRRDLATLALRAFGASGGAFVLAVGAGVASQAVAGGRRPPNWEWSLQAVMMTGILLCGVAALYGGLMVIGLLVWRRRRVTPRPEVGAEIAEYVAAAASGQLPYEAWRDFDAVVYTEPALDAIRRDISAILGPRPRPLDDTEVARLQSCVDRLRAMSSNEALQPTALSASG